VRAVAEGLVAGVLADAQVGVAVFLGDELLRGDVRAPVGAVAEGLVP